jgi:hypothetical protein
MEIAHRMATEPAPDVREVWAEAPAPAAETLCAAMARDPRDRPASAGQLGRSLDEAFKATQPAATRPQPETTRAMPAVVPPPEPPRAAPTPRAQRPVAPPPRRAAPPPRSSTHGLPRWIPVVALIAVLLVAAAAIAAVTNGGSDKGTPPSTHTTAAKKPKKKTSSTPSQAQTQTQAQQTTPSTTPAPTQSQTTPTPAASDTPAQMQLQAHNLINQGKYAEAIALDKQIVAKGPGIGLTYAYALFDMGHALRVSGHPDQAIPVLQQRLKINNQRDVVKAELEKAKKEAGSG